MHKIIAYHHNIRIKSNNEALFSDRAEKIAASFLTALIATAIVELGYGVFFDLYKVYQQTQSTADATQQSQGKSPMSFVKDMFDPKSEFRKHVVVNLSHRLTQRGLTIGLMDVLGTAAADAGLPKLTGSLLATVIATVLIAGPDAVKTQSAVLTANGQTVDLKSIVSSFLTRKGTEAIAGTMPSLVSRNGIVFAQASIATEVCSALGLSPLVGMLILKLPMSVFVVGNRYPILWDATKTKTAIEVQKHLDPNQTQKTELSFLSAASHIHNNASQKALKTMPIYTGSNKALATLFHWYPYKTPGYWPRVLGVGGGIVFAFGVTQVIKPYLPARPLETVVTKFQQISSIWKSSWLNNHQIG